MKRLLAFVVFLAGMAATSAFAADRPGSAQYGWDKGDAPRAMPVMGASVTVTVHIGYQDGNPARDKEFTVHAIAADGTLIIQPGRTDEYGRAVVELMGVPFGQDTQGVLYGDDQRKTFVISAPTNPDPVMLILPGTFEAPEITDDFKSGRSDGGDTTDDFRRGGDEDSTSTTTSVSEDGSVIESMME